MRLLSHLVTVFLLFLLLLPCAGEEGEDSSVKQSDRNPTPLTLSDAAILGLVEGLTEYLPVSSTGHLILTNRVLGLDRETQVFDSGGSPLWKTEPAPGNSGVPYTYKDAVDDYVIIIQAGAIAAVVILYWKRLLSICFGIFGKNRNGLLLGRNLVISFAPAVFFGLLLENWIASRLFGPVPVVIALAAGGLLMVAVERWRRVQYPSGIGPAEGPDLHELSMGRSLIIGLLQCIAMWPGTSRSMMTIVGGYLVGFSPARSAEYSFLLGLITLSAAAGYKSLQGGTVMLQVLGPAPVALGCIIAMIAAALAVRWLVNYLTRHGLELFAYYRFVLAACVLVGVVLFD